VDENNSGDRDRGSDDWRGRGWNKYNRPSDWHKFMYNDNWMGLIWEYDRTDRCIGEGHKTGLTSGAKHSHVHKSRRETMDRARNVPLGTGTNGLTSQSEF
jgi:hypothetical protein